MIVHDTGAVTLVGGGRVPDGAIARAMQIAPNLVAVDGGADAALAAGVLPSAVIGDFDSISQQALNQIPQNRLHQITEQETTDFDKALRSVAAPLVIGVGFTGARLDHQLAALNTLVRHADTPCILLGDEEVTFLCPPDVMLDVPVGQPVSLFPMARVQVQSDGLEWPTEGLILSPEGRIGTSNRITGPLRLRPDGPGLLVILPATQLEEVAQTLGASGPFGWPVRATR